MNNRKTNLLWGIAIFLLVSCTCKESRDPITLYNQVNHSSTPNTMSNSERKNGWSLLFDDKNKDGWHCFNLKVFPDCWIVEDGVVSGRISNVTPYLRRIPGATGYVDGPHEEDWIRACKESPESSVEGKSNFAYSGPFNEMVLLGVLAIRLQGLNKSLKWDAAKMQITNILATEELIIVTSNEFKVIDGYPHFNKQSVKFNALECANEYIKHTYRNGWNLPKMV